MVIKIIFCCLGFCVVLSSANSQKIDSLKALLATANGAQKCDILFWLVYENANVNNQISLSYAQEGYQCALKLGDSLRMVKGSRMMGQAYRRVNNLTESLNAFASVLPIAFRNQSDAHFLSEYKNILGGMAITYTYAAAYDKALDYNFKCLTLWEKDGNKGEISIVFNNIGLVYYKLRNYQNAIIYYAKAKALKEESKDFFDIERLLINTGLCYNELDNFAEAKRNFEAASKICNINCDDVINLEIELGLGIASFGMHNFDEAIKHLQRSLSLAVKQNNIRYQLDNMDFFGRIYLQQENPDRALYYLRSAEILIEKGTDFKEEAIRIYQRLYEAYSHKQDFKKVAFYQSKYIQFKDSIHNDEQMANLMKIEADHLERENNARIASQNQILQLNQDVIEKQKLINIFIGCMAAMLVLLAGVLIRSNRQKQKINWMLDGKVKERTRQLEQAHEALVQSTAERNILIQRTSEDMKGSLASIKGLCAVGLQDIADPDARQYILKVSSISKDLTSVLKNLQAL